MRRTLHVMRAWAIGRPPPMIREGEGMTRLRAGASVLLAASAMLLGAALIPTAASADPISGAIFTTDSTGLEVNANQYAAKPDVYLNGGPGVNAPVGAAGLSPDGTYIFQVTDPSGKVLLSQDAAQCREVTVSGGVITGVTGPCPHATGLSLAPGEMSVQLCTPPDGVSCFNDTPNNGGVYKVWMTPLAQYQCDLTVVDCGNTSGSNGYKHGFVPSDSKTDNFKVSNVPIREIDTDFKDSNGNFIDGLGITWTDPLGAKNTKWSEYNPSILAFHEAHVESVEPGTHYITVENQPGCTVTNVSLRGGNFSANGPTTVPVKIPGGTSAISVHIDVTCA
jgi:hypothetical protein